MSECSFSNFIELNSGFLITFTGMLIGCVSGTLVYFLKSRCTRVNICCMNCERQPINEDHLNDVELNTITSQ